MIDDLTLGPAAGNVRARAYGSPEAALADAAHPAGPGYSFAVCLPALAQPRMPAGRTFTSV